MKVLVTGGTGVVGAAAVRSLLAAGHSVRLFSRHARQDAERWQGSDVTSREGSVADASEVAGAAEGCDAVLHIAGIVEEKPPRVTFDAVNVGGTRNLLAEAEVAGVKRFVHVSSLGADRGSSAYHDSKRQAEELVRRFPGDWLILRPGVPESTVREAEDHAELEAGAVLTLSLPFRGNVQVRIVEVTDTELTLVTVAGHPLAGSNTFRFAGTPGVDLRFEVETCDRSATLLDELAMVPFGGFLKRFTWTTMVEEAARMAGALPPVEVETAEHPLTGDEEKAAVADLEKRVGSLAKQDERELQEEARSRLEEVAARQI